MNLRMIWVLAQMVRELNIRHVRGFNLPRIHETHSSLLLVAHS